MLLKIGKSFLFFYPFLFLSCGEFIGFDDFSSPDTGEVEKIEVFFTDGNLLKFYDTVSQPEQGYVSCRAVIDGGRNHQAYMKVRGYTSRGEPKKNFTLRFKEGASFRDYALMTEAGTWMKNRIVMYAYRNYKYKGGSLSAAPETKAAALFINGEYKGYYAKVSIYSEKDLNSWKKGGSSELFKVHLDSYEEDPLYSKSEKKFPDDKDYSSLELLISNLNRLSKSDWEKWALKYIDIDDFIRYMVVHDFFGVEDTVIQNFYIYNYGKLVILPWDNELGMDLCWDKFYGHNKITSRILEIPSVREEYIKTMKEFIGDTAFLEELKDRIRSWYDEAYKAVLNDPVFYYNIGDFDEMKKRSIDFIDNRGKSVPFKNAFPD